MNAPVTVLLADPYEAPRHALELLLAQEAAVRVVGSVATAAAAAEAVRRLRPSVLVVDADLVAGTGPLLDGWGPVDGRMRVVVVGMEAHPAFVSRLSGRGAAAYVLKDRLDEDLLRELRPAEGTGGHHERPAA